MIFRPRAAGEGPSRRGGSPGNRVCGVYEKRVGSGEPCSGTCTVDGSSRSCSIDGNDDGRCYTNEGLSCGVEGRCVPVPGIGEPGAFATRCQEGAFCDESGKCSPQRDTGSCMSVSFDVCSERAYCDRASFECIPRKADGAACLDNDECASNNCDDLKCRPHTPVDADLCAGRFGD